MMPQLLDIFWNGGESKMKEVLNGVELNDRQLKEILRVLKMLPSVDVCCSVQLPKYATAGSGGEGLVKVELTRISQVSKSLSGISGGMGGAYTPFFPKQKEEGWWLVLGDAQSGELIALRRILFQSKTLTSTLTFDIPERPGKYEYQLYFISDTYLGLDQQYSVSFEIK